MRSYLDQSNLQVHIPYARHYKPRLVYFYPIFHCGLYCRAVHINDNFWARNPWFIIKNNFKSRAGYNGACTVFWPKLAILSTFWDWVRKAKVSVENSFKKLTLPWGTLHCSMIQQVYVSFHLFSIYSTRAIISRSWFETADFRPKNGRISLFTT